MMWLGGAGDRHALSVPRPLVLVVEDFDECREMYAEALRVGGYRVIEAVNGLSALVQALACDPDLIVMDIGLPMLDGCETIERLRREAPTRGTPILVLSGHTRDVRRALEAGGDTFISKPCLPRTLLLSVRRLLSRRHARRLSS